MDNAASYTQYFLRFGVVMLGRAKLLERYYGLVCLSDVSGTIVRQHSRRSLLSCAITDTHTVCAFWEAYMGVLPIFFRIPQGIRNREPPGYVHRTLLIVSEQLRPIYYIFGETCLCGKLQNFMGYRLDRFRENQ
ncbi:hypothetical protein T02_11105 [Trichinella nativa]|uniref:Uncharacterized protein n=1 Tax=Trichinella nativa TaxID=6335 RepID=A0A0V1LQU9_9BILA|nr:hypothetical protein T02_11105 [Trichinella nativa]